MSKFKIFLNLKYTIQTAHKLGNNRVIVFEGWKKPWIDAIISWVATNIIIKKYIVSMQKKMEKNTKYKMDSKSKRRQDKKEDKNLE